MRVSIVGKVVDGEDEVLITIEGEEELYGTGMADRYCKIRDTIKKKEND